MTFFSLEIFVWMVAAVLAAWVWPKRAQKYGMMIVCAVFLVFHAPLSLLILAGSSVGSYYAFKLVGVRPGVVWSVVGALFVLLFWYKVDKDWVVTGTGQVLGNAVPLGLSYYAFRQIHYAFEIYKKKIPVHGVWDYLCYLFFLPTLLAGPIHVFQDFRRDLERRRPDPALFSLGLERILHGYAKMAILGNYVVSIRFAGMIQELNADYPVLASYLDCFRYLGNLYFQFSGYSDVAIGFSLLMGFHVIENFRFPFLARNLVDFWQRWHISLSGWCRLYVYTPMASYTRLPFLAIVAAMLVMAFWHELSLRFLCWGIYHGVGIALWHVIERRITRLALPENRWFKAFGRVMGWTVTMNYVALSFVFAKADDLDAAFAQLGRILTFGM